MGQNFIRIRSDYAGTTKPLLSKLAIGIKNWFKKSAEPRPYKLDVSILEDRILYSATAMPMPEAAPLDPSSLGMDAIEAALQSALIDSSAFQAAISSSTPSMTDTYQDANAVSLATAVDASISTVQLDDRLIDPVNIGDTLNSIDIFLSELDSASSLFSNAGSTLDVSVPLDPLQQQPKDHQNVDLDDVISQGTIHEVAFVQSSLLDLSGLIADIESEAALRGTTIDVYVLDHHSDGYAQIDNVLAEYDSLNAIHFVSHGSDGMIQLGGSWLTAGNIEQYQSQLQSWGMALSDDGDILIYGCDVAAGPQGQAFIDNVARLTGADIAASTNNTGDISRGGDWSLEYVAVGGEAWEASTNSELNNSGLRSDIQPAIRTQIVFGLQIQQSYGGLLATVTVTTATDNNDSGITSGNASHTITWLNANKGTDNQISLREAIIAANNTTGADTVAFSIGTGSQTISLSGSALNTITEQITLDGWTQSGYSSTPLIVIDANGIVGDGFVLASTADNCIIRGFVLRDFAGDGIQINSGSSGNTIAGNYIGSFGAGGTDLGINERNTALGINILGDNNTIAEQQPRVAT